MGAVFFLSFYLILSSFYLSIFLCFIISYLLFVFISYFHLLISCSFAEIQEMAPLRQMEHLTYWQYKRYKDLTNIGKIQGPHSFKQIHNNYIMQNILQILDMHGGSPCTLASKNCRMFCIM